MAGDSNFTNLVTSGTIAAGTSVAAGTKVTAGTFVVATKQTAITVTDATGFTPTGTYQPITAAGAVAPTVNILPAGTLVILINTGSQAITIADAGIQKLTADAVLGQNDSLTIISDGTNWIELARANN